MEILNKYKRWKNPSLVLSDNVWDFVLSLEDGNGAYVPVDGTNTENCLIAYIDAEDHACFYGDNVLSKEKYIWEEAISSGATLEDIGLTGMDNGLLKFDKDTITDYDFFKMLTRSELPLENGDTRLTLRPVDGNTKVYSYDLCKHKKNKYISFKGGFLQGFFKIEGNDYQTLPDQTIDDLIFEFTLRPRDYVTKRNTLNSVYPENRGLFFYMGTRAENKFAPMHGADLSVFPDRGESGHTTCQDYFSDDYIFIPTGSTTPTGFTENFGNYFLDNYFADIEWINTKTNLDSGETFALSAQTITDSEGDIVGSAITQTIRTDNKYLFFNRTKDGFTTDTWNDDDLIEYKYPVNRVNANLYLYMNRTASGLTSDDVDKIYSGEVVYDMATDALIPAVSASTRPLSYSVVGDITNNAFGLKINDDMSIGYRYLVKDCDAEQGYSIIEESTFPGMVDKDKWNVIQVRIRPLGSLVDACGRKYGNDKIKIYVYVNGYLKLVSKELDDFSFRALKDTATRQQSVPYCISLGGGTQGLIESIWTKYKEIFPKVLPLEQNFAGSFIGDIKTFKMYSCSLEYNQLKNNYLYEISKTVDII